jgi:D-lactate dehydrogenase
LGTRGFYLNGKTLGVIGTGQIGLRVIRLATAFEMEVVAYDIHR